MRKYPTWFIEDLAKEEDKDRALKGTLSTGERVAFLCSLHGIYEQQVFNHIILSTGKKKRGCPKCGELNRKNSFSATKKECRIEYPEWFINDLAKEEDKERIRNKEITTHDYLQFTCPIHNEYTQRVAEHIDYKTLLRKHGCPICGKEKQKKSQLEANKKRRPAYPEWFINDLANSDDKERAKNKELTWSDIVLFVCPIHGFYKQRVDAHMNTSTLLPKQGCPICGREKQLKNKKKTESSKRHYPQWFIDELVKEEDKERARQGTITSSEYLDFLCSKHGVYTQNVRNHIILSTGTPRCRCPICTRQVSCNEDEIYNYLISLGICVEKRNRTIIRNPQTHRPMELDIYIPDKKIAIEYNGSLWHSEKFKQDPLYHQKKFSICLEKEIQLVSIFDRDWFENKDTVKKYLSNLLLPKKEIVSTDIREITIEDVERFYKENCIFNIPEITLSYGIYHNNILTSSLSFFKNDKDWVMYPYCEKFSYITQNGAFLLFYKFINNYHPSKIVSYSNCDYDIGYIQKSLGFQFAQYIHPTFYWAKDNTFFSSTITPPTKGYYRVFRSGEIKWLWE